MEEAVFDKIGAYILERQNTVVQYIATRPILDLFKNMGQRLGSWVTKKWREQEGIDLASARERASEVA